MAQTFAVLGGGNGGQAIAACLTLAGKTVSIYDRFIHVLDDVKAQGGIRLEGIAGSGFASGIRVCDEVSEAVEGAEIIFVVLPAFAHAYTAEKLAECLKDGQTVILCPGSTGGALELRRILNGKGCAARVRVAETNSLFYAVRASKGTVSISGKKDVLSIAALPASETQGIIDDLADVYPQLRAASSVLETSLNNLNAIIHPIPVLLNAGRIESGEKFRHYADGVTPAVGNMVEAIDAERVAVGRAYGLELVSMHDSFSLYYGVRGETMHELCQNSPAHVGIMAPATLDSRLITEDVPCGLVPMAALGKAAGVATPVMDAVITLAGGLVGKDFRASGRSLKSLGLEGLSKTELMNRLL